MIVCSCRLGTLATSEVIKPDLKVDFRYLPQGTESNLQDRSFLLDLCRGERMRVLSHMPGKVRALQGLLH